MGKKRDRLISEYDEKYGKGNWRIAWAEPCLNYDDEQYMDLRGALYHYEKSYERYIQNNDKIRRQIVKFGECYDNDPSNINSGISYGRQENDSNHFQDISVRRVLARMGLEFRGPPDRLLHIRHKSRQKIGRLLSPGNVPFWYPRLIKKPELKGWWEKGTVESWYQSNKVLQVKEE